MCIYASVSPLLVYDAQYTSLIYIHMYVSYKARAYIVYDFSSDVYILLLLRHVYIVPGHKACYVILVSNKSKIDAARVYVTYIHKYIRNWQYVQYLRYFVIILYAFIYIHASARYTPPYMNSPRLNKYINMSYIHEVYIVYSVVTETPQ